MSHQIKTEGGFAHVMIIMMVVVLAAIGGIGYMVMNKNKAVTAKTGSKSVVVDKAIADECNKQLKDKDFCKFASNYKGLETYKTTITSTSAEGTATMNMSADGPDKTSISSLTDGKESSAFITIGKTSYTKNIADGSWTSFTNDAKTTETAEIKDDIKIDDFSNAETSESNKTQYKKVGKEACGSLTCFKYQITDTTNKPSEDYIWFDTKDFMLRRWSSKTAEGTTTMTFSYDNVKINVPSPIKETTTASGNDATMQAEIDAAMKSFQDYAE